MAEHNVRTRRGVIPEACGIAVPAQIYIGVRVSGHRELGKGIKHGKERFGRGRDKKMKGKWTI